MDGQVHCAATYGEVTQGQMDAVMSWKPPIDWSQVPINAQVVVWHEGFPRHNRYFATYENCRIHTFASGATSWSNEPVPLEVWEYGELADDN